MNSEISKSEVNEVKNPSTENFKNIKPEHETSPKEVDDFWKAEFHDQAEQVMVGEFNPIENNDIQENNDNNRIPCRNEELAGKEHPETGVPFVTKAVIIDGIEKEVVVPVFDSAFDAQLPEDKLTASDAVQNKECNQQLKEAVANNPELRAKFNDEQLEQINNGDTPDGYTWHHDADIGKMQLVDAEIHQATGHTGGRYIWGGGSNNR